MTGVRAEIIESPEDLARIEADWCDLWQRVPGALPFQSPAWLMPWWRSFCPGALFTAAVYDGGRLIGLAPGYIEDGPLGRRILPIGISLSDHLDVLADPARQSDALSALAAALWERRAEWDIWELEELRPGAAALKIPLPSGSCDRVTRASPCPLLVLPENGPVSAVLPRAKRRHLNLARNRAKRRGSVEIVAADQHSLREALEHLFRLHRLRWASRGCAGALEPEEVQQFQRETVPALYRAGLLRIFTLSIAGIVAAAHYELIAGPSTFVYLTGFDPDFEFESPGMILLAHAIETAHAEGRREVDFLRGSEPYKYEWGAVDRWNRKRSIRRTG